MEQPQRITNLEKFTALFLMKLFCPFINFNKLFIHFILPLGQQINILPLLSPKHFYAFLVYNLMLKF
jgi:hypothetical protein